MKRAASCGVPEEIEGPIVKESVGLTYAEFVAGPFAKLYMPSYRPATRERYEALHRQRVLRFLGGMRLREITTGTFRSFAAELHAASVQTKGPLNVVRTVLRAAQETGHLDEVAAFPRGIVTTGRKVPDAPTAEEVATMLGTRGWLTVAIALAALAGLRMGEVRALEVRDVDIDRHRLLVRRALSGDESLTPKSGHEREIPLALALEAKLREAIRDKLPRARVVLDDHGQTPGRQELLRVFKRRLSGAGLKERSFHALRHFFVSELMMSGASAEAVRVLAGHASLTMTQRYAHAAPADLRAAIDRLGR